MAESGGEKTDQATPERLRRSREEGRIPVSQELPHGIIIGAMFLLAALTARGLLRWICSVIRHDLSPSVELVQNPDLLWGAIHSRFVESFWHLAPFAVAGVAASVLVSVLGSGAAVCPKALRIKLERISPITGFKNLFSLRSLVSVVVSLAKLCVISVLIWNYLRDKIDQILMLRFLSPEAALISIGQLILGAALRIVVALVAIGLADMLYQRWQYKRDLRMTRQELKEELRQYELAPEVRGKIRGIQLEMGRRRMLQAAAKADVVVANPTHVAVALKYESGTMAAPVVVAKGADILCQKIKEVAVRNHVLVVERPALARALYMGVEIGRPVPQALYVAVAEVLALVLRLRRQH